MVEKRFRYIKLKKNKIICHKNVFENQNTASTQINGVRTPRNSKNAVSFKRAEKGHERCHKIVPFVRSDFPGHGFCVKYYII